MSRGTFPPSSQRAGATLLFYVDLGASYAFQYLKERFAYRVDFLVGLLVEMLQQLVNLVFILVVFGHTTHLAGWSRFEIIAIYGYFLLPYALFGTFFGNLWEVGERYVQKGEMDRVLTRPLHPLFQVLMETIDLEALAALVTGGVTLAYSLSRLDLPLRWWDLLLLPPLVLGSTLVYGGIYVALASISFFTDSKTGIMPMVYNIASYGRYPVDIYNGVVRFLLTWVLPFAFVGMYPASILLRREEWYAFALLTPVMGLLSFGIGLLAWSAGIRRYHGAGS